MTKRNVTKFAFEYRNAFVGSYWSLSIIYLMLIRATYKIAGLLGISKAKHKKF